MTGGVDGAAKPYGMGLRMAGDPKAYALVRCSECGATIGYVQHPGLIAFCVNHNPADYRKPR